MAKAPLSPEHDSKSAAASKGGKQAKAPALPPVRPGYYRGETYRVEESVGFLMKQAIDLVSRAIDARMAEHSLTDAQWRPLFLLAQHPSSTVSQLARLVGCDAGATTRMIDRLEDKGMVRRARCPEDRRVQKLELTPDGGQIATIIPYVISDVLNLHLSELTHAEIEQLRGLLTRVVATARRAAEQSDSEEAHP